MRVRKTEPKAERRAGEGPHGMLRAAWAPVADTECSPQERLHRPLRLQHRSPRWEELPKTWLDRPPAEEKPRLKLSAGSSRSTRNPTAHHSEGTRLTRGDALTAHPAPAKGTGHSGLYEDTPHVCNE